METNNTPAVLNDSRPIDSQHSSTALPYPYPIVFVFLYTITAVLSIGGNILVVIVLIVRKRLTKGVRYLLVNLAVADLFLAVISIPSTCINQVYGNWFLSSALCTMVMFVEDTTQVVSVLTLTLIGIDRYFAILFPLKFLWLRSDWAIITGLVTIWLVAIGDCMIDLFFTQTQTSYINGVKISECVYEFPTHRIALGYFMSNVLITYPIPIVILIFAYTSIAWKLYHHTSPGNVDAERNLRQRQNMIKVIKMLVVIVVVFVLCWTPSQFVHMMTWASSSKLAIRLTSHRILNASFTWFALCNCFVNPIIYCFSNGDFWKDLKIIFEKTKQKLELPIKH